jgi:hypothetical protein
MFYAPSTKAACALAAAMLLFIAAPASAATITYDFTGFGLGLVTAGNGTDAANNTVVFTGSDGSTVRVSGWYLPTFTSAFDPARVGQYSTGLGVCNASESCPSDEQHQVDNIGQFDFLLFQFSSFASVNFSQVVVNPFGTHDTDITYYFGSSFLGGINGGGVAFRNALDSWLLTNVGLGTAYTGSGPHTSSPVTHALSGSGNWLLIAARAQETDRDDRFKLSSITVTTTTVPEPASLLLLGIGLAVNARRLRRRS